MYYCIVVEIETAEIESEMNLTGEKLIPIERAKVWVALHDAERLKNCISGCETLEWKSDSELDGRLVAKLGPVKAKFHLVLTISDSVPETGYTLDGKATAGAHGFANGRAEISLADADDGCCLNYTAQLMTGGRIAQVGSRLMSGTAKKLTDSFFEKFVESLKE